MHSSAHRYTYSSVLFTGSVLWVDLYYTNSPRSTQNSGCMGGYLLCVLSRRLGCTRAPLNYTYNPVLTIQFYTNFSGTAIHCWRPGIEKRRILSKVYYAAREGRNRAQPGWNAETSQVARLPRDEKTWWVDGKIRLRAEEKSFKMMTALVQKFARGGHLLMDACA